MIRTLLILCVYPVALLSQEKPLLFVAAPSGLNLRAAPDGKILALAPYLSRVTVLAPSSVTATVDGITAQWVHVQWKDVSGFAFGGYLAAIQPPALSCSSLESYATTSLHVPLPRTYYQIHQNSILLPERYSSPPMVDFEKQILVLRKESRSPSGVRYESSAINGVIVETLTIPGISPREAFLVGQSCLPPQSRPVSTNYSKFVKDGQKMCINNMNAGTYKLQIGSADGTVSIQMTGVLGGLGDCPVP